VQRNTSQADPEYGSRCKRRDTVKSILVCLSAIRDAEQTYLDNMPGNFQCSESFETGENAVDAIDEVIALLADVY